MRRPSPRFGKHCLEHHWTMVSCERFIFLGFRTSLYRPINRLMESQPTTFLKNEYIIISRSMEFSRLEKDFSHIHLLFILMTTFGWAQQNLSCLRVGLCRKSSEIDGDSGRASNSSRPRRDPLKSDERKPKSQRQFFISGIRRFSSSYWWIVPSNRRKKHLTYSQISLAENHEETMVNCRRKFH